MKSTGSLRERPVGGRLRTMAMTMLLAAAIAPWGGSAAAETRVGLNVPLAAPGFWRAYAKILSDYAKAMGLNAAAPVNSNYDLPTQIADIERLLDDGAQGIITTPVESTGILPALRAAAKRKVPVVAVDVAPTRGPVAIVVRADNRAYGKAACLYMGEHVASGTVVQIMGDLASINGHDRAEGFRECMTAYPNLTLLEIPADWDGDIAARALDGLLAARSDIQGVYMHAGGVFLKGTLATLKAHDRLKPLGAKDHVVVFSSDGSPEEFAAIRAGELDATISQPPDLYAKYALLYLREAMEGKTFAAGPTDHASAIVEVAPGVLEDQLPAPLVTKANVDDKTLWGNQN